MRLNRHEVTMSKFINSDFQLCTYLSQTIKNSVWAASAHGLTRILSHLGARWVFSN